MITMAEGAGGGRPGAGQPGSPVCWCGGGRWWPWTGPAAAIHGPLWPCNHGRRGYPKMALL